MCAYVGTIPLWYVRGLPLPIYGGNTTPVPQIITQIAPATYHQLVQYQIPTRVGKSKGAHLGIFSENPPFFGPESCVFEIALVSLVGVGTYEKILRTFPISNFGWYGPSTNTLYVMKKGVPLKGRVNRGYCCRKHGRIICYKKTMFYCSTCSDDDKRFYYCHGFPGLVQWQGLVLGT